jgi:hypothetical protein
LDGLAPSTLELTVSRPENFASFISSLENAGLAFPAISKINAKFSDLIAQSASIGLYVADLLAALPPPRKFLEFRAF